MTVVAGIDRAAAAHVAMVTDDDIIAALTTCYPSVVAIDAPLSLPAPVAQALRAEISGLPASSPYMRAAERDAIWAELGLRPLPVSFLCHSCVIPGRTDLPRRLSRGSPPARTT